MLRILAFILLCLFADVVKASKPQIALVIDDLGYRPMPKEISEFPSAVSIAIIPFTDHDQSIAQAALAQKREFLLHLPMQSATGPHEHNALTVSMNKSQIQSQVQKALYRLPNAVGVNNHMGSIFTQHPEHMGWVMETLHTKRLGFLDSRTSARTVAQRVAKQYGIATNRRHIFLDHKPNQQFIENQLRHAIKKAQRDGMAIVIAHPLPISLKILQHALPQLQQKVELIPISQALKYERK